MRIYIALTLAALLSACAEPSKPMHVCSCSDMEKVTSWIAGQVKAANNMSDEEMEDVLYALRGVAISTHCPLRMVRIDVQGSPVALDSCATYFNPTY